MQRPHHSATASSARPKHVVASHWLLLGILLCSLLVRLWLSWQTPFSYDETHNLMIGRLAAEGYVPYRQIYSVIAPLAVLTMQVSAALWGATPAVRLLMILYGLLGIAALFDLVRRQAGALAWFAATVAAIAFSFNPQYLAVSTSLNLEAGALAFALAAMVAIERYRTMPRVGWLLLAGVCVGLSIIFKIFVPYIPGVIALQLFLIETVTRGSSWRRAATYWRVVRQGLLCAIGIIAVLILFFFLVDGRAYFNQVVASRFELREAINRDAEANIAEAIDWADIAPYLPLLLGAISGVVAIIRRRLVQGWVWVAWALLASLFLWSHDPVRPRHLVTMLPALAALSGIGVAEVVAMLRHRGQNALGWGLSGLVLGGLLLLPITRIEQNDFIARHPVQASVRDYVQQRTMPDDCLVAKENRLHFLADRLSTPDLSILSSARLHSGLLPAERIMDEIDRWGCPVLVYTESFDTFVPALRQAATDYFSLHLTLRNPAETDYVEELFVLPFDAQSIPPTPHRYLVGDQFRLRSWALTPTRVQTGEWVYLAAYWETLRPPDADYKISVHWIDAAGNRVAAFDHYPFAVDDAYNIVDITLHPRYLEAGNPLPDHYPASGMLPTRLWLPGNTLKETIVMQVPSELAPGEYEIRMGMYDEASMAALPIFREVGEQNGVTVGDENLGLATLGRVQIE